MLTWKKHPTRDALHSEKDGRRLEIEKRPDGTWWLKVWTSPASSRLAGVHANPETAQYAAEHLPAEPDLAALGCDPHGGFRFKGSP